MATCSHCGQEMSIWSRDVFSGACPRCQAGGARPANLGCGTLIAIALIVLFVSRSGVSDLKSNAAILRSSVEELKKASDAQTNELRDLRRAVEELRKSGAGKDNK